MAFVSGVQPSTTGVFIHFFFLMSLFHSHVRLFFFLSLLQLAALTHLTDSDACLCASGQHMVAEWLFSERGGLAADQTAGRPQTSRTRPDVCFPATFFWFPSRASAAASASRPTRRRLRLHRATLFLPARPSFISPCAICVSQESFLL